MSSPGLLDLPFPDLPDIVCICKRTGIEKHNAADSICSLRQYLHCYHAAQRKTEQHETRRTMFQHLFCHFPDGIPAADGGEMQRIAFRQRYDLVHVQSGITHHAW